MKRLAVIATLAAVLAGPVAAQSLSILLPSLAFPVVMTTTATMDGLPSSTVVCPPQK